MSDSRRRYHAVKTKLSQALPEFWLRNPEWMTNLSLMVSAIVKADDLPQSAIAAEMETNQNQGQTQAGEMITPVHQPNTARSVVATAGVQSESAPVFDWSRPRPQRAPAPCNEADRE